MDRETAEKLKLAITKTIDSWEYLKGNKYYSQRDIESWLSIKMKPAIDELRKITKYHELQGEN